MKRFFPGALMALIALFAPLSQVFAYEVLKTSDGKELRWFDETIPFYLNVDGFTDFDSAEVADVTTRCMDTWSRLGLGFRFEFAGLTQIKKADDDELNIIFFEQDPIKWEEMFKGQDQAFAMTRNWAVSSGGIQGFDMVFNDSRYQFTNTEDPAQAVVDYCNTLTHEVGHVLGMDHSSDKEATMYGTSSLGELSKRDLTDDDISGLRYLYREGFTPPAEDTLLACSFIPGARQQNGPVSLVSLAFPAAFVLWRRRKVAPK